MGLQIHANIDSSTLASGRVVSESDLRPKSFKSFVAGDSVVLDLFLTGQDGLLNIQAFPTVRLGFGTLNARPTGGNFTYGAQTIAYNASASALDTAITAENAPCTVTLITPFVYKVAFNANGAQTIKTVDATGLTPTSTVLITKLVTGTGSTKEQWLVRIFANPIALVDTFTNIDGQGIRGSLNLGTAEIYQLLGASTSVDTTIELELTDTSGNIQTIFQMPAKITGEVIGQGVSGAVNFSSFATASSVIAGSTRSGYVIVSAANGSDTTAVRDREDLAFATPSVAMSVATAGDTFIIRDGDFSNSAELVIADDVTVAVNPTAIAPICSTTASRTCTLIGNFAGVNHASIGTVTLAATDMNFLDVTATSGTLDVSNSRFSARSSETKQAVQITNGCAVRIDNSRITSDDAGQPAIQVSTFTGSVVLSDCEVKSSTATGSLPAHAMRVVSTLTGSIQLKDCTLISTTTGSNIGKTIEADVACTGQLQGSLNGNNIVSTTVTLDGGILNVDSNYDI